MKAIFTLFFLLFSSFVFANNIQLQKVSLSDTNRTAKTVNIKMNISWEHSWRDSINWDAAWIIVKYKEPKDSMWKWKHAQLVQAGNNTGTATAVKIVVPDDRTGAFFYRSAFGEGNISSENVKLLWNYGAAGVTNIDSVEVRVFATEMVYVPDGSFCLGDGDGTQRSFNSFQIKSAPNNYAVINDKWSPLLNTQSYFNSEDDIVKDLGFRISGTEGLDVNNDRVTDYPDFPTGYKGFYCMKYKTTQGQYTDFLNTLHLKDTVSSFYDSSFYRYNPSRYKSLPKPLRIAWSNLEPYAYSIPSNDLRHSIRLDSIQGKFVVSRPDRVHLNMTTASAASFADWLSLRQMSELEYEKASRGPLAPKTNEGAGGNDTLIFLDLYADHLSFSGVENGTEFFSNYDISKRRLDPVFSSTGGDGGQGPVRAGIFATDTSSRLSSGASYYGIMDLTKIGDEIVISVQDHQGRKFNQNYFGVRILNAFGNSYNFNNLPYYPFVRGRYVSLRSDPANPPYNSLIGFRAVRLAPSDN